MKHFQILIARVNPENGNAPEWILLFDAGWVEIEEEGKFLVDQQAFSLVDAQFKRRGLDIVFDYEHQTIEGVQAPAAGWIKALRWTEGVGIEARVEWNEAAADMIVKKEYRYHSPVFYVRKSDKRLAGLHSVALTNAPKTNHLKPLLAKLGDKFEEDEMDFLKKLIAKLGLKEDTSEDQALEAVVKLKEKADAKKPEVKEVVAKEVIEVLKLKDDDDVSTVVAAIHALNQEKKGMVPAEKVDELQKRLDERDAADVVAKAMAAGKITPDQKNWATDYATRDLKGFESFVAKAPVVVPVEKLGRKTETGEPTDDIDETTLEVAKSMGLTKEDLQKYGGLE